MRLIFHAFDVGPGQNLALIADEAAKQLHHVVCVVNGPMADITLSSDDVVITGLSTFGHNNQEIGLGRGAKHLGIPWVVVDDTHRSWARPEAKGEVEDAILLIASPAEVDDACKFGYSRVEYLGGPPRWQNFYTSGKIIPSAPTTTSVVVGGSKDAAITDQLLESVILAMEENSVSFDEWSLLFKPHPREFKETIDLTRRNKILRNVPTLKLDGSLSDLILSTTLSVFFSGTTGTVEAACKRRRVISFENEAANKRMISQSGSLDWPPLELGAVAKATPETMSEVVKTLLNDEEEVARQVEAQRKVYPSPKSELFVVKRIVDFLISLAKD